MSMIMRDSPQTQMPQTAEFRFKFAIGALTVFAVVGNSWLRRTAR